MAFRTAIVKATVHPSSDWTYTAAKCILRAFDQCERGLIPVEYIKLGQYSIRLANAPFGPIWVEIIDSNPEF